MTGEAPKQLHEGEVFGTERNASNGVRYAFAGHYKGDRTVSYRANVTVRGGEHCGELAGTLEYIEGTEPRDEVVALLKAAIREGVGYRP